MQLHWHLLLSNKTLLLNWNIFLQHAVMVFQWLIRVEPVSNKKPGSPLSWLDAVNDGRSYSYRGLQGSGSFCEMERIMSAITFYLENSPNGLMPIKILFFTGLTIIKSDLPIIFLIFLLILSPGVPGGPSPSEDGQGMGNGSPCWDTKTRHTATIISLSCYFYFLTIIN